MKNYLTILFLLFFVQETLAYEVVSLQQTNPYYRQQRYINPSSNQAKRIERINKLRNLNRLQNSLNNLSWNLNRNNRGTLTGYSTPISKDVYKDMGSDFWDKEFIKTPTSIKPTTELFSVSPTNKGSSYNRGRLKDGIDGLNSSTGVRIIYD